MDLIVSQGLAIEIADHDELHPIPPCLDARFLAVWPAKFHAVWNVERGPSLPEVFNRPIYKLLMTIIFGHRSSPSNAPQPSILTNLMCHKNLTRTIADNDVWLLINQLNARSPLSP